MPFGKIGGSGIQIRNRIARNRREALFQTVPVGGNGGADVAEIRKVVFSLVVVVVVLEV